MVFSSSPSVPVIRTLRGVFGLEERQHVRVKQAKRQENKLEQHERRRKKCTLSYVNKHYTKDKAI